MKRAASAGLAVASVILLATCDLATLTKPNEGGTPGNPFDSTELTLGIAGATMVGGVATVPLLGTATMSVTSSSVSLANVVKRYYATQASTFVSVDSVTGVITGSALGTAKVTAKILAPELGAGVTISQNVRVRYKGIKLLTPLVVDSMSGLGQTRTATYQGTNNNNVVVAGAITLDSLRMRTGAGVIDTSSIGINGNTLTAKKNGTAYVVAFFDGLRDSVLVKVRQVAKSITFPTTDYTARHVNFNLSVPFTAVDVANQPIPTPTATWSTKDTLKATATGGVFKAKTVTMAASDSVFVQVDTVKRGQRILVAQVIGSVSKISGDARSDTVAKNVKVLPVAAALDSGGTPIVGTTITFRTGLGVNASVNDTLPITTNAQGRASPVSWKLGDVVGTNNNTLVASSGSQSATFTASGTNSTPKKLAFVVSPVSASVGNNVTPPVTGVTVQVQDSLGNPVTSVNAGTVSMAVGNNPGGAALGGTLTANIIAGVATFTSLNLNQTGSGYTLAASSGILTSAVSNGFDIFGTKNKLGFFTQPVNTSAGAIMSTVRVAIQDAAGNTVGNATDSVNMAIGTNGGGGNLSGTTKVAAVAGVATFSTLSINNAGAGYTLLTTASGLTQATSNAFTVAAVGAAAKLAYQVQPSNVVAGAVNTPSIKVQIQDANGALVTTSSLPVTLSIESTSPSGATINGTLTRAAAGGVATFDDITINKSGTGYKLLATAVGTGLTTATSTTFNVTAGTPSKLGFFQQPTHTIVSTTMAPSVVVEVQDANSNRVTTGSFSVSLAMSGCSGTLVGGGAQVSSAGIATFSGLSNATQTNNCVLVASASGLTNSPNSTAFNIVSTNGPVKLSFTTEPSASVNAGSALATAPVVAFQDNAGNNVSATATSISLSILSGPQTLFSNGTTQQNSVTTSATFSGLTFNTAGTYRILASATGYRPDTSVQIVVSASTINRVGFVTVPVAGTAGVPFSNAVQVAVQDQFGNTVTGATNLVTISASMQVSPFTSARFAGNVTSVSASAVSGIATFTGLAQRTAGASFRMFASSSGLTGSNSGLPNYDMAAAPASALAFTVQPTPFPTVATTVTPDVLVAAQDSVGNTVTDFSSQVTLALVGGTAGTTLGGTKTRTPVSGVATFNDLTLDRWGDAFQIAASATGVTTANSNTFRVDPFFLNNCCTNYENSVLLGSTLYFVGGSALKSVPVTSGTPTTITGSTNAVRLATDGTNIYWAEQGTTNNGDAFIKKLTVSGGGLSTLTTAQTNMMDWAEGKIYADATNVYFVARNLAGTGLAIKSVGVNAVSTAPTELFPNTTFGFPKFLVDAGFIYFFDPSDNLIKRMSTAGGSLTTLSTAVTVTKLTFDGTTLYFADGVTVKSIPNAATALGPVTPTTHTTAPGTIHEMVAKNGILYVAADGILMRYPTANFASGFAMNNSSGAQANQWYTTKLDFDGTYMYFFSTFGRFARVPK
jgi:hypothetical protein